MLSLLLVSGAIGTLLGGPLSDRVGRLRVLAATLALMTPALLIFLNSQGIVAATALSFAGFFLVSSFAVTVVMAQEPVAGEREPGERHDGGICVRRRRVGRPADRP